MRPLAILGLASLALFQACGALLFLSEQHRQHQARQQSQQQIQHTVTWDNHSLSIDGERLMIFSGEIHPFRLPVPSLWLDLLQKIKALGFNTASFYVNWALLEGEPGVFRHQGIFELSRFFEAAKEAGLYLIARPGPYINAEVSGGGYPGWLQRVKGHLRTADPDYLAATDNYMSNIARIISEAQLTNGGPVILYQPENEYTSGEASTKFPDPVYMQYVIDQARSAGIVVPFMSNDAGAFGHNAPGSGTGAVDIYGYDSYPLGLNCSQPTVWPAGYLPTNLRIQHLRQSPLTPHTIPEFQGGSYDPWGGPGFDRCEELLNHEQIRVFFKNNYAAGVSILSTYMIFGGSNWGNLGNPGGYTSYDYAAAIAEDRSVSREKYSELKLEANFLKVSPGYLVATPNICNFTGVYSLSQEVTVTGLIGEGSVGSFYVVRHIEYQFTGSTTYTLLLSTSAGLVLAIPQLGGSLTLSRRDSKIHVTDYPVGSVGSLLYSTAEIFTWQEFDDRTVLVVYSGAGETHELALDVGTLTWDVNGSGVTIKELSGKYIVAQWDTSTERRILKAGNLEVHIVDRNSAYSYWAPELSGSQQSLIVVGGYLIRSASKQGDILDIKADFNTSTSLEIIGVPNGVSSVRINNVPTTYSINDEKNWIVYISYQLPLLYLVDFSADVSWFCIDSLPEIQPGYDDSLWPKANHRETWNSFMPPLQTPVSLYGSDYGFHAGVLVFRGSFTASGFERALYISTIGGAAFGSSVWINGTFVGSWSGDPESSLHNDTYLLPWILAPGETYVFTVVVDNLGLEENLIVGDDNMKTARGILNYKLLVSDTATDSSGGGGNKDDQGRGTDSISWKITGNLGGESYIDHSRGPLNEGGLFAERQGFHLPRPPLSRKEGDVGFTSRTPIDGMNEPGILFYSTSFTLDLPKGQWDIPLRFVFANDTGSSTQQPYRAWLYVNGFQFGRYLNHIGPQTEFPVPEGILDYGGENWVGLAVWATQTGGAKVPHLSLEAGRPILSGREPVDVVRAPAWTQRPGAY